jgi:N-methylhydantoinase A
MSSDGGTGWNGRLFGVDTGGTFTDVVLREANGNISLHKLLSTPSDPSRAIVEGIRFFGDDTNLRLVHGSTVATNALLERRGAQVLLVVSTGFEDLLYLRRQNRPQLYTQNPRLPAPLVGHLDTIGVDERVLHDGRVQVELTAAAIESVVRRAVGYEAVAICFLHAYANPSHEKALKTALTLAHPALHISASHEVLNEFREYERASTTAINAYVGPVMTAYLHALEVELSPAPIDVIQSNGGRYDVTAAAEFPVNTILSGPAGGVVGAWSVAKDLGFEQIIGFDMGGTSTDVSLCDGAMIWTNESEIDGIPIRVPVLDIHTVGAGGGSIAWRDEGGALRVGPRSAGASPGPACYGQGGLLATVTDANLFLGRIPSDARLAGEMRLDLAASTQTIAAGAAEFGIDPVDFARGIIDVANASMVRAIRVISVERGKDPREFKLISFGGAGGLHACALAEDLGINTVVIPAMPGLLSAYGMLKAASLRTSSKTVLVSLGEDHAGLQAVLDELRDDVKSQMPEGDVEFFAECRYVGQSFELSMPWALSAPALEASFHARHEVSYGYRMSRPVEVVNVRAVATRPAVIGTFCVPDAPAAPTRHGVAVFERESGIRIMPRQNLREEQDDQGPMIVVEFSSTTLVPQGWSVSLAKGHILLVRQ